MLRVQTYADTITKNYRDYHIRTLKGNLSGNYPEYAREQLDAIENGTANLYWYKIKTGKKFYKIVQMEFETWESQNFMVNTERDLFMLLLISKLVKFINLHHGKHPPSTLDSI